MSIFTGDHAFALAEIAANGAAVTFSRLAEGYDAATDLVTPAVTTIPGKAIQVRGGSIERFRALGLVIDDPKRLLFAPDTFGQTPVVGDTVVWAGDRMTAKDVELVAPDGNTILAYVTVGR
jgi:hypothetical protein